MRRSLVSNSVEWKVRVLPCQSFPTTLKAPAKYKSLQSLPLQTQKALQLPSLCTGRSPCRSLGFYLTTPTWGCQDITSTGKSSFLQTGDGISSPSLLQPHHSTPPTPYPPHLHHPSVVTSSLHLEGSSLGALTLALGTCLSRGIGCGENALKQFGTVLTRAMQRSLSCGPSKDPNEILLPKGANYLFEDFGMSIILMLKNWKCGTFNNGMVKVNYHEQCIFLPLKSTDEDNSTCQIFSWDLN